MEKKNIEKKELTAGYVDLSEKADIKEALFNLYDVLHQLKYVNIKNILFLDLYNNEGLYKVMQEKLKHCCGNKRMMIPLFYD